MQQALQIFFSIFMLLLFSYNMTALADDKINLSEMETEIYLQPWPAYQKLIGMQIKVQSFDEIQQLWWLVRKAQAENLIYSYDDFSATVKQANSLVKANTPLEIKTRLKLFQGIIERRAGSFTASEQVLTEALAQAKSAKLIRLYVYIKKELAYSKTLTGFYEASFLDMQEAFDEALALNDQFLLAAINETFGAIYSYLDEHEQSIAYYQRALAAYQNFNYPTQIAEALYGLASTYRYWKKYDLAIEYFLQYQQNIGYTPNTNILFFAAYGLGMTYAEKGDCSLAISMIDRALTMQGIIDFNAELYKRKASCLIALGQFDAAEESLLQADAEFSKLPEVIGTEWHLEVTKISAALAHARGQYKLAYQQLEQYYQQYSELLLKNASERLVKVRERLEDERQQVTQAMEERRLEVASLQMEQRNSAQLQQKYFNLVIVLLVVLVLAFVVVQYQRSKTLHRLTIKDPLTDLYNRRYVFDYLNKALVGSQPAKTELVVIAMDIDDFKQINDQYGHPVGDEVIRQVAHVGKQIFRQDDVFARIGGEEFMCILQRTSLAETVKIAERFLGLINESKMIAGHHTKVTVSMGIAALSAECQDAELLYINADKALYQAKHSGKNKVCVFNSC